MMKINKYDYSESSLRSMYSLSIKNGYKSIFFGEEATVKEPFILWRHDVDIEWQAVQRMARIEYEEGINSTYFLMLNSWFYNLFSNEARETINILKECGHNIGLHCDLEVQRDEKVNDNLVNNKVEKDFLIIDNAYPDVFERVVSFHNPPKDVINREFSGFYSTYAPKFFNEIKYLSDSNRNWREGRPENWYNTVNNPKLSILLHPIIWKYGGVTMSDAIKFYLEEKQESTIQKLIEDDVHV